MFTCRYDQKCRIRWYGTEVFCDHFDFLKFVLEIDSDVGGDRFCCQFLMRQYGSAVYQHRNRIAVDLVIVVKVETKLSGIDSHFGNFLKR